MIADLGVLAPALVIVSAGAIPAGLIWGTALVWVTVALLLASLVGVLAQADRPPRSRRAATLSSGRWLQVCTACAS